MPADVALSNVEIEKLIKFHGTRLGEHALVGTETALRSAQEELDRMKELRKLCPSASPHL